MMRKVQMLDLHREYQYMQAEIDEALKRCLNHQQWIFGPEVKELENQLTQYLGCTHCIGTSSGTDALVVALRALANKLKGQEYFDRTDGIITTPFTFTATGDAILRAGATPVFVDIHPATCNINPAGIREYLTRSKTQPATGLRVVGIIPVHLYGQSCYMDEIMAIAKEFDLFVLEDVAQAFGASWDSKKLGTIGTAGAFSFFPSKNLGGFGDGGMVCTDDDELAAAMRMLIKHGGRDKYNVDHIGYNARIDTLQAAILLVKLRYIDEFNRRRANIASLYSSALKGIDDLVLPRENYSSSVAEMDHVFHQFTIQVLNGRRDELRDHLALNMVDTMIYYPVPLHKMGVFQGRSSVAGQLDQAERASEEVLSLPIEPLEEEETFTNVAGLIKGFLES